MAIPIFVNGKKILAPQGATLAGVLFRAGQTVMRHTPIEAKPRSVFCGMGVCFDCVVTVDGRANVRACRTQVQENMQVFTQKGEPAVKTG